MHATKMMMLSWMSSYIRKIKLEMRLLAIRAEWMKWNEYLANEVGENQGKFGGRHLEVI